MMKNKYANFILECEDNNGEEFNNYQEAFSNFQRKKVSSTLYGVVNETGEITTILTK